jgi:hypothetical protein
MEQGVAQIVTNKKLFLVQGRVEFTPYVGKTKTTEVTRIVWALTEAEAESKFFNYWENKSGSYLDSYFVSNCTAYQAIE